MNYSARSPAFNSIDCVLVYILFTCDPEPILRHFPRVYCQLSPQFPIRTPSNSSLWMNGTIVVSKRLLQLPRSILRYIRLWAYELVEVKCSHSTLQHLSHFHHQREPSTIPLKFHFNRLNVSHGNVRFRLARTTIVSRNRRYIAYVTRVTATSTHRRLHTNASKK